MRASKTTLSGTSAAIFLAVSQIPELPQWLALTLKILSAAAIAALGYHAAECPLNCPGTDLAGRKRRFPAGPVATILLLIALGVILAHTTGCTVPNPAHAPGDTNTSAFIIDPGLAGWSNAAVATAHQIGPLAPGLPFLPSLVAVVFAVIGSLSVWLARVRNRRTQALAQAVALAGSPTVERVLDSLDPRADVLGARQAVYAALDTLRAAPPRSRETPPAPPPSRPA